MSLAPPVDRRGRRTGPHLLALALLSLLVVGGIVGALALGSTDLSVGEVVEAVGNREAVDEGGGTKADRIVWRVRAPRAFLSILVGLNLAVAGVLLQGVMRNPLASPGIIGVMAGAALFATLAMLVLPAGGLPGAPRELHVPAMAFIGAMLAAAIVFALSWQPGTGTSPTRMILAGVAVTAMVGAAQNFLSAYFADRIAGVLIWLAGSLSTRGWAEFGMIWPFSLAGFGLALALARPLNLLQLGEDSARSLGVSVQRTRLLAVLAAALLTASAVCVAGIVGFVGLVVPHIVRTALSPNHRWLIPASALAGAALVGWADVAARQLGEMPVGVLTAAIGGPYFVYLLYRTKLI
ncbi:MAG: iron ABC transporter permease [Planctomycetota bacterium]